MSGPQAVGVDRGVYESIQRMRADRRECAALFDSPLDDAVTAGHLQRRLSEGEEIDTITDGGTWIYFAAKCGAMECMRVLLAAGADIDKPFEYHVYLQLLWGFSLRNSAQKGYTPLMAAVCGGHVEAVKLLVSAGVDLNKADEVGGTPLLVAALDGSLELVKLLVEAGAQKDLADKNGFTPLYAAALGHPEVV